ncbi:Thioesterase [Magnetospirillum sp. LM-5]|uniref:acyl-CoA thioesterase n=1 Tax=Magnetospirillum sp. LM-5 TaxID=2681466 RepID=UPI00137CB698|nr:thioesterase family protein [Magnetospirillum sp. LM-5]CAA7622764.1 Thioesterase [Magnetospirillum sp. LM-5]
MSLYVRQHRVAWGDCDPAGILYTPRVFDYCNETLEGWYRDILGSAWMQMIATGTGSPMVHVECDFIRPMAPDLELTVSVRIERLGSASITFLIDGHGPTGDQHFAAKYVVCITDFKQAKAIPIPDALRERAEAYERTTRQP